MFIRWFDVRISTAFDEQPQVKTLLQYRQISIALLLGLVVFAQLNAPRSALVTKVGPTTCILIYDFVATEQQRVLKSEGLRVSWSGS